MTPSLILASASPRRKALLATLNLPFSIITSGVDEVTPPGLSPKDVVVQLAARKANAVAAAIAQTQPGGLVLGADTAVVLGKTILGKPADAADAARMLRLLRGKHHRVISGIAVIDAASGTQHTAAVITDVEMAAYTDDQIAAYVASGEPMDKAGSYAIQGVGGELVAGITGCYNNVVGLPLCEVGALLARFGVSAGNGSGPVCALPSGEACPRLG